MNNFIPLLRADRLREINEYANREYIFRLGQNKYNHVGNFIVTNNIATDSTKYYFEARTNQKEPRFYLTVKDDTGLKECCIYLKLFDIYILLYELCKKVPKEKVTEILLSERNMIWRVNYTRLNFEMKFFSAEIPDEYMRIPESNIKISYQNLFCIIALIQDKSNYFWSISTEENKNNYTDGIIRLLVCLINTEENSILESHMWKYISKLNRYELRTDDYNYKYYLTLDEYENIMEV